MNELSYSLENLRFANEFWIFIAPTILMATDIITGLINAWAKKEIKSSKMRQGLAKKCGEIVILGVGALFKFAFGLPWYVLAFISLYVMLMESISICENLDKLGVPIPKFISKVLNNAKEKIDEKGGEKDGMDESGKS